MVDFATITAAIGAATAGVELIDKIGDQISRLLTKHDTSVPVEHRGKIERDGDAIVRKSHGVEVQRITHSDLQKLPEAELQHIKVLERSMKNHYAVWASVYPQLALMQEGVEKARVEQQLKAVIVAMKGDLIGILDFLSKAGLQLDDHYIEIRDVVAKA